MAHFIISVEPRVIDATILFHDANGRFVRERLIEKPDEDIVRKYPITGFDVGKYTISGIPHHDGYEDYREDSEIHDEIGGSRVKIVFKPKIDADDNTVRSVRHNAPAPMGAAVRSDKVITSPDIHSDPGGRSEIFIRNDSSCNVVGQVKAYSGTNEIAGKNEGSYTYNDIKIGPYIVIESGEEIKKPLESILKEIGFQGSSQQLRFEFRSNLKVRMGRRVIEEW